MKFFLWWKTIYVTVKTCSGLTNEGGKNTIYSLWGFHGKYCDEIKISTESKLIYD